MTNSTRTPGRPDWDNSDLYKMLCDTFPRHRTEYGVLDVKGLAADLGYSYEAVYKWLRRGRLRSENAESIIGLANKSGLAAPVFADFEPFLRRKTDA